jgi:hypothetical protein
MQINESDIDEILLVIKTAFYSSLKRVDEILELLQNG